MGNKEKTREEEIIASKKRMRLDEIYIKMWEDNVEEAEVCPYCEWAIKWYSSPKWYGECAKWCDWYLATDFMLTRWKTVRYKDGKLPIHIGHVLQYLCNNRVIDKSRLHDDAKTVLILRVDKTKCIEAQSIELIKYIHGLLQSDIG